MAALELHVRSPHAFDQRPPVPMALRPMALKRVVTNLIDNAVKFAGSAELLLERPAPNMLNVVVRDDGPGIPEGELGAVMQPFYRVESSRNRHTGGTGLGLAIAHELARALDATLALENRPVRGLEARLSIKLSETPTGRLRSRPPNESFRCEGDSLPAMPRLPGSME